MTDTATQDLQLDVRGLPCVNRRAIIFGGFDRLTEGESLIVINDHEPVGLRGHFEDVVPGRYRWKRYPASTKHFACVSPAPPSIRNWPTKVPQRLPRWNGTAATIDFFRRSGRKTERAVRLEGLPPVLSLGHIRPGEARVEKMMIPEQ